MKKSSPKKAPRKVKEAAVAPVVRPPEPAPEKQTGLVPFDQLKAMAQALGSRKLFGKSPDELLPLMLIAQAEGLHPATAAQEYDIIQGKPAINSRAALARFQKHGGKIRWITRTDKEASAGFQHPSMVGELIIKWDMDRARQAGLATKPTWRQYPAQMLASRVVSEGVRASDPACLSGMYTVEEVQDFVLPAPRDLPPLETAPAGYFDPPQRVEDAISADKQEADGEMRDATPVAEEPIDPDAKTRIENCALKYSWKGKTAEYQWVKERIKKPMTASKANEVIDHIIKLGLPKEEIF